MRRMFFLPVAALFLCGCATVKVSSMTADNRMNLSHLSPGMSRSEALSVMGTGNCVYNCDMASTKPSINVRLNNPYRTETIQTTGKTLEVIYYITDLKNSNCVVDDDGLTPLVFENSRLIGWGNNFLLEAAPEIQKKQQPSERQVTMKTELNSMVTKAQEPQQEKK
ncbi:MAG: DUF3192 domain-containing protein [Candidatus Omnitrophica bacterium]|nr:DUF3192 domain-containing protein [Candidatus Omnitrophota bacterium]